MLLQKKIEIAKFQALLFLTFCYTMEYTFNFSRNKPRLKDSETMERRSSEAAISARAFSSLSLNFPDTRMKSICNWSLSWVKSYFNSPWVIWGFDFFFFSFRPILLEYILIFDWIMLFAYTWWFDITWFEIT